MIKKILLSFVVFSIVQMAQGQIERMPFEDGFTYTITKNTPTSISQRNLKDAAGILLYDDFENYAEGFDPQKWSVKRSSDINGTDMAEATSPAWFVCNPASFYGNGFNYINSGEYSAAISYLAEDFTWLISNDTLDVVTADLMLHFWLNYYNTSAHPTLFHVLAQDVEEGVWLNLQSWGEDSPSNQYQQRVSIPLDTLFNAGVEKFVIAFVYENVDNSGFQVAIDDITVGTIEAPLLRISPYHLPYSTIPASLAGTFSHTLNIFVHNIGDDYSGENAAVKVTIPMLNNFESVVTLDKPIQCGELKIYEFPQKPVFVNQNDYDIIFFLDMAEQSSIDTCSFRFAVTQDIFATDYCNSSGVFGGVSPGKNVVFGNFYNIKDTVVASGIEIRWPAFSTQSTFKGYIYELNPVDSSVFLIYQGLLQKQAQFSDTIQTFTIEPRLLLPGTNFFVAVEQIGNTPLGVGYDRVRKGHFWRLNSQQRFERVSNPSIGNVAVRLKITPPVNNPLLSFTVTDGTDPIEGAVVQIAGENELITNADGFVSTPLANGLYTYSVSKDGFIGIADTVKIQSASVHKNIVLQEAFDFTFTVTDNLDNPLPNAEILILEQTLVTNADGEAVVSLASGNHGYCITKSGYIPANGSIAIPADTTVTVILEASELTNTVNFAILEQHNDEPAAGVRVSLANYGVKFTNASGEVSFNGILSTDTGLEYSLFKHGYHSVTNTISSLNSDTTVQETIDIIRYSLIARVLDTLGNAIMDAGVTLGGSTVMTNVLGYAVIDNLIPKTTMQLKVSKEGFVTQIDTITVTDANVRKTIILKKEDTSSILPVDEISLYTVYPNPGNGLFNVKGEGVFSVQVFDLTGRLLYSYANGNGIVPVDLRHRASGVYIVKVISKGHSQSLKIIKR